MNSIDRWNRWLEANMVWAALYRRNPDTIQTPELIYLVRDGQPVEACNYAVAT